VVGGTRGGRFVGRREAQCRGRRAQSARFHLWLAAIVRAQRTQWV